MSRRQEKERLPLREQEPQRVLWSRIASELKRSASRAASRSTTAVIRRRASRRYQRSIATATSRF
jgi:hypothetical protein